MNVTPAIVVHGGAGLIEGERIPAARAGCAEAAARGLEVLRRGGSALDAVQAATRVLEEEPGFNAGVGSALTRDGTVETDAAIMEGTTLRAGAVGAVPWLRRAIDLARDVLEDGEHVLLVGEAAWTFARERGHVPALADEIITEKARRRLGEELARRRGGAASRAGGTVGACAIDGAGRTAVATSTGGITGKRPGRVGDTPLIGCGTYADDRGGAASATGTGEAIIRLVLCRLAVDEMRRGAGAAAAARAAIAELDARLKSDGGIICIDSRGEIGIAKNVITMPTARATLEAPDPVAEV